MKSVLVSFFESVKYVGHLFPIALLRVYLGYFYVNQALTRYGSDFLSQPQIAEEATHWMARSPAPDWYQSFLQNWLVPNWHVAAYALTIGEGVVGIAYILGYLARPAALLAVFLNINLLWIMGPDPAPLYKTMIAVHFVLGWLGAGRCLGMDYYFYKKRRGIWW